MQTDSGFSISLGYQTKPGLTKPGNIDIGLCLENKVKNRVRVRVCVVS